MIVFSTVLKIIALGSYIFLGLLALRSNTEKNIRLFFSVFLFGMIFWQFTSLMVNYAKEKETALFWYNLLVSGSGLFNVLFFPFTRAFLGITKQKKLNYLAYFTAVFIMVSGFLGLQFQDVYMGRAGYYVPSFNNIRLYIMGLIAYFFWGYGVFNLIRGLVKAKSPFERNRIKYVLLGAGAIILGAASNFTPLREYPIDISFNLIAAIVIGYAVVKHRLLDIREVLIRSLSYSVLTSLIIGIYILTVVLLENLLKQGFGYTSSLYGIIAIIFLAVIFLPLRNIFQKLIDKVFFREKYDYQKNIEEVSKSVISIHDADTLLGLLMKTLMETVRPEKVLITIFNEERKLYVPVESAGIDSEVINTLQFRENHVLMRRLRREGTVLIREEMKLMPEMDPVLEESQKIFDSTETSLVIPLLFKGRLIGTLHLGRKKSGTVYNEEDLRFLITLTNQIATALDSASVYREVERRLAEQTLLFILSETFKRPLNFESIIQSAVRVLVNFLNIDACLLIYYHRQNSSNFFAGGLFNQSLAEKLKQRLHELTVSDSIPRRNMTSLLLDTGSILDESFSSAEKEQVVSQAVLMLRQQGEIYGFLVLPKVINGQDFGNRETDILRAICAIITQGIMLNRIILDLVEMKSYSDNILNSMSSSVLVVDTALRITSANNAVKRFLNRYADDLLGKPLETVPLLRQLAPVVENSLQHLETTHSKEVIITMEDGRSLPLGISTSILKDAEEKLKGVILIFTDLSDIKLLENQLIRSEKLASIGQLAAGVSHELRNPLGSIFGYAELIKERIRTDDEVINRGLETILSESERSQHIIESLLDYSRLKEPTLETADINQIIEDTLPLIYHQLAQENISISKQFQTDISRVRVDIEQMREVFINLILNAQQAMSPNGGTITIRTKNRNGRVLVSIADEGKGIPREDLNKLFDPFFTTKDEGTGLGLPIVHRIIENHHGFIEVDSNESSGSVFTLSFDSVIHAEEDRR
jgi:PAS domain S-box-containing protein